MQYSDSCFLKNGVDIRAIGLRSILTVTILMNQENSNNRLNMLYYNKTKEKSQDIEENMIKQ